MLLIAVAAALCSACYGEGSPSHGGAARSREPVDASLEPVDASGPRVVDASAAEVPVIGACTPADATEEPEPARSEVLTNAVSKPLPAFVKDLFSKFNRACGDCHVNGSYGNPPFHVSPATFSEDMPDEVLSRIFSNDPAKVMPPESGAASSRNAKSDPYLQLGGLLKEWYRQGKPRDFYFPPATAASGPAFQISKAVGLALTNLGNCIPSKDLVGVRDDGRDAFFESAVALPPRLEQTDLTTFDSEVLAQTGVVAYAPAYPLWADDARKIRYVRVPRGQSIRFDESTQQFDIPDNTRFYKTFLKRVVQRDGNVRYRKVETRVIVVRHAIPGANGQDVQTALFGTYSWTDDEREALLVDDRYHDGKPFVDVLRTLVVDERKSDAITAAYADAGTPGGDLTHALVKGGATRSYAIPGSDRCMQCHMGSPSRTFVLGFTPLQINRRPLGASGIIDAPSRDELTQLQRLIDYGIITGVENASDILPLEDSQGDRKPRNDHELVAQGYMLGNCAHCHNPRGFPSIQNPDTLANFLSFMPGTGPVAGIFQLPLEKFSPRIFRDIGGSVPMPYITPSLVDFPGQADFDHQVSHIRGAGTSPDLATDMVLAPWRSLIYRNVDTPFPYSNDQALFPHMPMNTPGFDCRAPRIMAEWMLSIPAVRKRLDATRTANGDIRLLYPENLVQGVDPLPGGLHDNQGTDVSPQPYLEVLPGDERYDAAVAAAQDRLDAYHGEGKYRTGDGGAGTHFSYEGRDWPRYGYCPDTTDIVDPSVTGADRSHLVPSDLLYETAGGKQYRIPVDYQPPGVANGTYDENLSLVPDDAVVSWPDDGIPDRPHWVVTDTTDSPGPWAPRRSDWKATLVDHETCPPPAGSADSRLADVCAVVEMLSPKDPDRAGVTLTPAVRDYALGLIPYGLWQNKPACAAQLANVKKVKDFDSARPKWMDVAKADPSAPVYAVYPGAAVYDMVCINCHGPKADSHGRQADTLQIMTGGSARVANFRDGLFGPLSAPGANRRREFAAGGGATPDDWAARYVAWMALGGTQKLIPKSILDVVVRTPVFGVSRQLAGVDSANMLGPIQTLCSEFFGLPFRSRDPAANGGIGGGFVRPTLDSTKAAGKDMLWELVTRFSAQGTLLTNNGDAELFGRLCALDNPMPVAAIQADDRGQWTLLYFPASAYGTAPIGNDQGAVDDGGVLPGNVMPWCVHPASTGTVPTADGKPAPTCPASLLAADEMTWDGVRTWSFRGAINAGLAAFLYIDKVESGYSPVPGYDHCEQLR